MLHSRSYNATKYLNLIITTSHTSAIFVVIVIGISRMEINCLNMLLVLFGWLIKLKSGFLKTTYIQILK